MKIEIHNAIISHFTIKDKKKNLYMTTIHCNIYKSIKQ